MGPGQANVSFVLNVIIDSEVLEKKGHRKLPNRFLPFLDFFLLVEKKKMI